MKQLNVSINLPAKSFLLGLAAAIGLILFSSTFSTSAATTGQAPGAPSGTITGCLGNTNPDNPGLSLGGRVMTTSTILRIDPSGNCAANENSLTWNVEGPQGPKGDPTYTRTFVVNSTTDKFANGIALLSAMTTISNSNPPPAVLYLVKLEPGVYDLGDKSLNMLPYVDIEGSGEKITHIVSTVDAGATPANGVVNLASNSEGRQFSIYNLANTDKVAVVFAKNSVYNASFNYVTLNPPAGGKLETYGLYSGGNVTLRNTSINVENSGVSAPNVKIFGIYNAGVLTLQNSNITISNNIGAEAYAIINTNGGNNKTTIQQSTLTAINASQINRALDVEGNVKVSVQNSTLTASSQGIATAHNTAFYNNTQQLTIVQNSTLIAYGPQNATNRAIINSSFLMQVGGSELQGGVENTGTTLKCVASYDVNFDPLDSNCTPIS